MGTLEKALPGRQNAKDWLTLKIVECMSEPMDDKIAGRLETYNAAYNALCQWNDSEESHNEASVQSSAKDSDNQDLTIREAKMWTANMQNADGTKGPHWTLDQAKQIMAQRNIPGNPTQFWVAISMIYSDYCEVIKKAGANTIDFYANMARAFLEDKDAMPGKLSLYYHNIVK